MKYTKILLQLVAIQQQLSDIGCEPVADKVEAAIDELIYAYDNNLIK